MYVFNFLAKAILIAVTESSGIPAYRTNLYGSPVVDDLIYCPVTSHDIRYQDMICDKTAISIDCIRRSMNLEF